MYGADPYASIPYASGEEGFDIVSMLSESRTGLIYTVELVTWHIDEDEEHIHYYATQEWATKPTDIPPSQPFDGRLITPLQFRRSVIGERVGINHSASDGQIVLGNSDGELDNLTDTHSVDARRVTVRLGRITDDFVNHLVIFNGVGVEIFSDAETATISIRDNGFKIEVPVQPNVYAGTGGSEGGDDIAGKRRPISYGNTSGLPGILINGAGLIYELASNGFDPALYTLPSVWDRGVPLIEDATDYSGYTTLAASAPIAGHYTKSLAAGLIKLGATPDGIVFSDPSLPGDVGAPTTSELINIILQLATDLEDQDLDEASFDRMDTQQSRIVEIYLGIEDALSVLEVISNLMMGIGGWVGFNRDGKLSLGRLIDPVGVPVMNFDYEAGDIIAFARERLPSGVWPMPWRWRVAWDKNETVFDDFAGSVGDLTRAFFAEPYRLAIAEDSGIIVDHPKAQDLPPIEAYFDTVEGAQEEADRLLDLYSSGYGLFSLSTTREALRLNLGDLVSVTHPRFGFDLGGTGIVVEISDEINLPENSEVDQVRITIFGPGFSFVDALYDFDFVNDRAVVNGIQTTATSLLTTVRASTGYADDAAGTWYSFANNIPRITDLGVTIEEARTNSIRNNSMTGAAAPSTFPTNWGHDDSGLTATVTTGVNTQGMDYLNVRWTGTTSSVELIVYFEGNNNIAATVGQVWTLSMFYKLQDGSMGNVSDPQLEIIEYDAALAALVVQRFDIALPTDDMERVEQEFTILSATCAWVRPRLRFLCVNPAFVDVTIRVSWPQMELGRGATTPIRTTTVAVARAADQVYTPISLPSNKLTLYAEGQPSSPVDYAASQIVAQVDDNTSNERVRIQRSATTGAGRSFVTDGGVTQADISTGVWAIDDIKRLAMAVDTNDFSLAFDGDLVQDTAGTLPVSPTWLRVGAANGGGNPFNGRVRRIAIFDGRRSDARIVDITEDA